MPALAFRIDVAAVGLWGIGTFGLLGSERGPLAGVFLVPLGLPWNLLIDAFPEPWWPWLAAAAPLINAMCLCVAYQCLRRPA
jgi:hypothetical protein